MRQTVLFVDDNPVILKTIELAFAKEEYEVLLASSGEEALRLVEEDTPQVIVSDLRMTGMSGMEFLHQARQRNHFFVGMIFTAYLDIDSIMQAVSDEAVWRYITKPWQDNRELVMAVRNAFQYHEAMTFRRQADEQLQRAERLTALGHLVAGIAHQFNNIDVGILGYVQMALLHKELPEEVRQQLEQVRVCAKRGTEIIKELSTFSDQNAQWGFTCGSLTDTVIEAISFCRKELESAGVQIETELAEECTAVLNFGLVKQLVMNLIRNAAHATLGKKPPTIRIETGRQEENVFVRVTDNGCGISKAYLPKIFDPFFTTKGAQAAPGSEQAAVSGVGLGLSLSQTVAQAHRGLITVHSTPNKGSCFTFSLPKA
ncbi:sensor histidine kinase [Thiovibrio frasassiensis]|uniref:histidine kinase n=1 Tax=Thiovibrio frasassiensis TaxID=2984131 RepID=A0A9X4MCW0_9BACT|nr:ATP-binding protein [Thiovibrio frasassiensis]MDG4475274.1 ATP-binding protein [Thiovibrio frasassiensis]